MHLCDRWIRRLAGITGLWGAALGLSFTLLIGCAASPLQPGAERIIVARQVPPESCKFVGAVVGQQGDFLTGRYTSNKNLAQGALNDIRNRAFELGANFVSLQSETAGQTGYGSSYQGTGSYGSRQTDVTKTGNAYACPPRDIGLE